MAQGLLTAWRKSISGLGQASLDISSMQYIDIFYVTYRQLFLRILLTLLVKFFDNCYTLHLQCLNPVLSSAQVSGPPEDTRFILCSDTLGSCSLVERK